MISSILPSASPLNVLNDFIFCKKDVINGISEEIRFPIFGILVSVLKITFYRVKM